MIMKKFKLLLASMLVISGLGISVQDRVEAKSTQTVFADWKGTWEQLTAYSSSSLTVGKVVNKKFDFSNDTLYRDRYTGEISGTATIKGNKAYSYLNYEGTTCVVVFEVKNKKTLEMRSKGCGFYHGLNGFIGGIFKK